MGNMKSIELSKKDLEQLSELGISEEKILSQIETIKKGTLFIKLNRPATPGDGITVFQKNDIERLIATYSDAASSGRVVKFVPASGAATRMFQLLLSFYNSSETIDLNAISSKAESSDIACKDLLQFINGLKEFAFYEDLKRVMSEQGLTIESSLTKGRINEILESLLTPQGLNYANLPKGLIKFHKYSDHCRTPIEEHIVECIAYTQDNNKVCRIHFTVSSEHEKAVKEYIDLIRNLYEKDGIRIEITFSTQKRLTDTIAVDMNDDPFRDNDRRLLFRPAGHGALLENLQDLEGDIVFIKNIDNLVPDRLKEVTVIYKKTLGGYLVELQDETFSFLRRLSSGDVDDYFFSQVFEFLKKRLSVVVPDFLKQGSEKEKIAFLFSRLNRPLRICGMVKNEGKAGGGPFWVEHEDRSMSLQIVEKSQIDFESDEQRSILELSTHFNPVDIVCGLRNYLGIPFNLRDYIDPDMGFISVKSKDGKKLKALELPGLWNGSMANWNTIFVEVPSVTFNPVKTVLDLLRKEHQ